MSGDEDDTDSLRARIERFFVDNPDAGVTDALGGVTLSPDHYELVEGIRAEFDGDDTDHDTDATEETHHVPAVSDEPDDQEHETDGANDSASHNHVEDGKEGTNPDFEAGESDAPDDEIVSWAEVEFTTVESGVWPPAMLKREQWMGHVDKKPFSPWADRYASAPCTRDEHDAETTDECDCDARWKWGYTDNYVDGETIAIAEDDPRLDGRAFLQTAADPFAYVDGDDVRDPETGEVHPAFTAILNHLGLTYGDISQSGSGVHAMFRGKLPEGVKQAAWQLDDESFGANDDLPSIEIYARKRVCVATGEHVRGTPTEVREWDADVLRTILDANNQLPEPVSRPSDAHEDFDPDEYDPGATGSNETTDDIRDMFVALDRIDPKHAAEDTIVHRWNDDASTSDGTRAFAPTWGRNSNGTANVVNDKVWYDSGDEGGYGGPVVMALIDANEMSHRNASPRKATGSLWWKGIEHLRELGYDIPRYEPPADDFGGSHQYQPEKCVPPVRDCEEFDREERWNELQGDRYEAYLDASGPHVWADPPGTGKSTNAERAAADRDRPYFAAFDKHEKGREAITDDATPGEQYHLKGGEQPREECCMDAAAAADEGETAYCTEHGHPSEWPRMCPIYEREKDDPLRQRFEALVGPLGTLGAHLKLGLFSEDDHPWHGSQCCWSEQFDHLLDDEGRPLAERVVGVHEYQLLKSATKRRDVIVDETPRTLVNKQRVESDALLRVHLRLRDLADVHRSDDDSSLGDNLAALAEFADDLAHAIAHDDPVEFADLDTPDVQPVTFERRVDPDDLPAGVDSEDVERSTWREYQGVNGEHYVEHDRYVAPTDVYDEPLAQVKLAYNEGLVRQIQQTDDELPSAPFCIDAVLAAVGKAGEGGGIPIDDVRRAIAVPPILDDCPWCGSALDVENGAHVCASDECDWDERKNSITQQDGEKARSSAWIDDDPKDLDAGEGPALVFGRLPAAADLPDDPLILDATATPEKVAGLYGVPVSDVEVRGDEPLDLDGRLNVTQVLDGQYHANTIRQSETAKERIQNTIETAINTHDKPLFGIRRDLIPLFEFAGTKGEDYELLVYGGARGLNRTQCDAVVCIGAPHPDMNDIQRQAELLSMDRDDLRAGGEEYSTRRNAPNPPVYRKLLYEDENGTGLAMPTKAYSGVAGALFREAREKELRQFIHRTRPLLNDPATDEPVEAYLLTNVPTDIPVDEVCRFEELADDLSALFPVPEGGIELLGHVRDVLAGDGPDGFRADTLVEERDDGTAANKVAGWHRLAQLNGMDVTERTVRNWIDDLESAGLLTAENYEHRVGVSYTADISTLKSALQVLSSNASFEVAAVRRFAEKVRASDGTLEWLEWAESVFTISGDRCGWDPPPNPSG